MTHFTTTAGDIIDGLKATLIFASKEPYLELLHAVRIKIDGNAVTLTATDRYRLGIWTLKTPHVEPDEDGSNQQTWVVRADDIRGFLAAFKVPAREREDISVTISETEAGQLEWRAGDGRFGGLRIVKGQFPPVENLVPDGPPTENAVGRIALNPRHLADFAKVPGVTGRDPLTFEWTKPGGPLRVRIGTQFVGLIMPRRLQDHPTEETP